MGFEPHFIDILGASMLLLRNYMKYDQNAVSGLPPEHSGSFFGGYGQIYL